MRKDRKIYIYRDHLDGLPLDCAFYLFYGDRKMEDFITEFCPEGFEAVTNFRLEPGQTVLARINIEVHKNVQ